MTAFLPFRQFPKKWYAHASDTLSATESNNVIVEELAALSGQLETLAQELKEQ